MSMTRRPDIDDAINIITKLVGQMNLPSHRAAIHRHALSKVWKARVHFGTYRPCERTLVRISRPQLLFRPALGHGLCDRERVPNCEIAQLQYWHSPCFRERCYFIRRRVRIKDDSVLIELDACFLEQQPRAQRPRGVILISNNKFRFHCPGPVRLGPMVNHHTLTIIGTCR